MVLHDYMNYGALFINYEVWHMLKWVPTTQNKGDGYISSTSIHYTILQLVFSIFNAMANLRYWKEIVVSNCFVTFRAHERCMKL